MLESIFLRDVLRHALLPPGGRVLACVSGGADSVAMLRLLADLPAGRSVPITVAHVNHRVRGAAADADQLFVESLAGRLGLPCLSLSPGDEEASRLATAGEEGLRQLRHRLLKEAARRCGASRIALAHTLDDQAETILMRLLRGSGRRGVSGMRPAGPGRLIRPMLGISRRDVVEWLGSIGQSFRDDETNADTRFLRNRIRHRVMPLLAEINPSVADTLARAAEIVADEDDYLDSLAGGWLDRVTGPDRAAVPARELAELPPPLARRVARELLRRAGRDPRGTSRASVERILQLAAGGSDGSWVGLAGGMRAGRRQLDLVIEAAGSPAGPPHQGFAETLLSIPGQADVAGTGLTMEAFIQARAAVSDPVHQQDREAEGVALLDARVLGPAATIRTRRPGDLFHPLGGAGRRKLKAFLIDSGVPRGRRDDIPLVVGERGIAWVVGHRIGHIYRVTEQTQDVAVLRLRRTVESARG